MVDEVFAPVSAAAAGTCSPPEVYLPHFLEREGGSRWGSETQGGGAAAAPSSGPGSVHMATPTASAGGMGSLGAPLCAQRLAVPPRCV